MFWHPNKDVKNKVKESLKLQTIGQSKTRFGKISYTKNSLKYRNKINKISSKGIVIYTVDMPSRLEDLIVIGITSNVRLYFRQELCFLDEPAYRQRQDIENPRLKKEIYVEKGRRNKFFKAVCVLYKMCLNKKYFEGFLGTEIYVYLYVKVIEGLFVCVYQEWCL